MLRLKAVRDVERWSLAYPGHSLIMHVTVKSSQEHEGNSMFYPLLVYALRLVHLHRAKVIFLFPFFFLFSSFFSILGHIFLHHPLFPPQTVTVCTYFTFPPSTRIS